MRKYSLGVDTSVLTELLIEDAGSDVLLLALTCLPFPIKIPDRFNQGLQDIGAFFGEGVINVVGGYDIGFTPFKGSCDTQQTNDIRIIGMEVLTTQGDQHTPLIERLPSGLKRGNRKHTEHSSYRSSLCRSQSNLLQDP